MIILREGKKTNKREGGPKVAERKSCLAAPPTPMSAGWSAPGVQAGKHPYFSAVK